MLMCRSPDSWEEEGTLEVAGEEATVPLQEDMEGPEVEATAGVEVEEVATEEVVVVDTGAEDPSTCTNKLLPLGEEVNVVIELPHKASDRKIENIFYFSICQI